MGKSASKPSLIARTALGDVRGVAHDGLVQFRGVPYAVPPLGKRRFRPPQPIGAWQGELDATAHGPIAPQGPSRLRVAVGDFSRPQSEDCLTLTITTPAPDNNKRPVIVWLHGGGYGTGAGSLDWYDGATLVHEGDVVVVGVNYRLGPLGYLYYDGLSDGQMGLQDMIAAIRWVAAHIAAFGGHPGEITLMGQSAGAHSALCMMAMPETRKLFRHAILESAPGVTPFSRTQAAGWTRQYLEVLGLGQLPQEQIVQQLQAAEPGVLLQAAGALARKTARLGQVEPPFFPVVDELAGPGGFLRNAAKGAADGNVAVVVGTNHDEARAIVAGDPRAQEANRGQVDAYLQAKLGTVHAQCYWQRRPSGRPADILADAMTDVAFARPSHQFAAQAAQAGADVWAYRLDWAPAGSALGACHCLELPLIFNTAKAWASAPMLEGLAGNDGSRDSVARPMRTAWLSFARHGKPSPELPWPVYDGQQRPTMVFSHASAAANDPAGMD
jgi:para-nitrobenzyl esterase